MGNVDLNRLLCEQEAPPDERAAIPNELELPTFLSGDVFTCSQNLSNILTLITEEVEIIRKSMPQVDAAQGGASR